MLKDKNSLENDLDKYQDFSGLSLKEMNFGLWLSEKRQKIIKFFVVTLIIICAGLFIYSSYSFFIYFKSSDLNEQSITGDTPTSPRNITANLEIDQPQIFSSGGRYDLAIRLNNPNNKFLGNFKYCFTQNNRDLFCGDDFILPGTEKYILALAKDLPDGETGVSFTLSDVFWTRINAHKINNWAEFSSSRLDMVISDISFNPANYSTGPANFNNLEFIINNQSPYSYYELPVNILMFNGSELVGINRYKINNLLSAEKRPIKISWPGTLSTVSKTEIRPDINIMDDNVYLKYSGQSAN